MKHQGHPTRHTCISLLLVKLPNAEQPQWIFCTVSTTKKSIITLNYRILTVVLLVEKRARAGNEHLQQVGHLANDAESAEDSLSIDFN